jgi:ribosomal protein L11 methyltransferase
MQMLEYRFFLTPCTEEWFEILAAELSEYPFDMFELKENYFSAYISEKANSISVEFLLEKYKHLNLSYEIIRPEIENWNSKWESGIKPLLIDNECLIRTSFHTDYPNVKYQILIDPKMSFGTGHHETTELMIRHILQIDCAKKSVLDLGCGTGILAILTAMKDASKVIAVDNDEWIEDNVLENIKKNNVNIHFKIGTLSDVHEYDFDLVIANINRNVLLDIAEQLVSKTKAGGVILLSGFYASDLVVINEKYIPLGCNLINSIEKNNWLSLKYVKN